MRNPTVESLAAEVRFLRRLLIVGGALGAVGLLGALTTWQPNQRFGEIDVERINVVEKDGALRMVISNRERSTGPIFKGKPFGYAGGNRPGIIFFNDEQTENGGLTFSGVRSADGKVSSTGHLSFDQYNQDQVVYLQYIESDGQRRMGLTVADRADVSILDQVALSDSIRAMAPGSAEHTAATARLREPRPGEPSFAPRVFVGRSRAKEALLTLGDRQGRTRARLVVDSLGVARLEFLDAVGTVTHRVPETGR